MLTIWYVEDRYMLLQSGLQVYCSLMTDYSIFRLQVPGGEKKYLEMRQCSSIYKLIAHYQSNIIYIRRKETNQQFSNFTEFERTY